MWFGEQYIPGMKFSLQVTNHLYSGQSRFQKIDVIETEAVGRVLLLDGHIMFSDFDEFVYHEMIVHPALLAHPDARQVCVIGGGDGGCIRELLKYPNLKSIVLCEIDEEVVRISKEYFPALAKSLSDSRVQVNIEDGMDYIGRKHNEFDVVLADTIDPTGPAVALYEAPFFSSIKKALRQNGVFVSQIESVFSPHGTIPKVTKILRSIFRDCRLYGATMPTYPTGYWNFIWASDGVDPYFVHAERQKEIAATCRYYTPEHQRAAFAIPAFSRAYLT
jgi:spermidine synthase